MKEPGWSGHHWFAVSFCLAVFVAAGLIADLIFDEVPHLEDEVAYLFQAQVFSAGKAYVPAPFHSGCFFAPFVLDSQGRRFGKYPPGWPALLSLGVSAGQTWWVNAACASVTVALVFRVGCDLHKRTVGMIAAGLAATSPFLLLLSGSLMSHTSCLMFCTAFLWGFERSSSRGGVFPGGGRGIGWAVMAGLALGCAFAVRPFTAVAVAVPAAIHVAWRIVSHGEWRRACWLGLSAAGLALLVPAFNAIWTGDPLLSPYVLFWPYDRLGFGPGHGPLEQGNTPWSGLGSAVLSVGHLANHLQGWPALSLVFVVTLFAFKPRRSRDVFLVSTALSLLLAYVLYWTNGDVFGPRYVHESVSALFILSAAGILRVERWVRDRASWGRLAFWGTLVVLLAVDLGVYLPWQLSRYRGLYGITDRPRQVLHEANLSDALVIVRDEAGWKDYAVAFSMNAPTLDGSVVYASECPSHTEELLSRFPGRAVYYFDGESVRPFSGEGD